MAAVQTPLKENLSSLPVNEDDSQLGFMAIAMAKLNLVYPWSDAKAWKEPEVEDQKDRIITLAEVSLHDSYNDCWVVIYDRVYDITSFFDEHPGGADIMLEYAGQDASTAFRGSGHSRMATKALERFQVGELPMHERMYRRPNGIRLSDIPE